MENIALIFAGGTGQRMNTKTRPKQFLELHNKPILLHTLQKFDDHPFIDHIVVVCLESWIPFLQKQLTKFDITKVAAIVPGGDSGQASIRNGVFKAEELFSPDSIVLVHDGVRPLIDEDTITACIEKAREFGNAITVVPAIETIIKESEGIVTSMYDRSACMIARAPQCFTLSELADAHRKAQAEGKENFIDSSNLMLHYGTTIHTVEGGSENIKITTPTDFYIFRAILDAQESSQIFGY